MIQLTKWLKTLCGIEVSSKEFKDIHKFSIEEIQKCLKSSIEETTEEIK